MVTPLDHPESHILQDNSAMDPGNRMNGYITKALRIRKVLIGKDFYQGRQCRRPLMTIGNRFAEWTFCPEGLGPGSVVYSFGTGEDISFDLGLMEEFGLEVHAFDPSPSSVEWIAGRSLPGRFHFHPYGLGKKDGQVAFEEPAEPGARSLRIREGPAGEPDAAEDVGETHTHHLPVRRLPTIVSELGHTQIDILKMDIEGAEYDILDDVTSAPVPVGQVLIEFHHRFPGIGTGRTREAIRKLNRAGYRIFHVSPSGEEISFILTQS